MKNRGYVVVLDAIFALAFILLIMVGFTGYQRYKTEDVAFKKLHYTSEDVFDTLNKQGVLDDIGEEWAAANGSTNSTHWLNAQNITGTYLEQLIPGNMGYSLTVDDVVLFENTSRVDYGEAAARTNAERLLVGYGKGLPTRGYVSRAFLTNIMEKTNSRYAYFGGFVGQGDITYSIRDIPDANIIQACMELNTGDAFDLYVNDAPVGSFTPSGSGMNANIKGSDGCIKSSELTHFNIPGDSKLEFRFTGGDINKKYLGGGFLRVTYNTTEAETEQEAKTQTDWLHGITGLINYYSSFYVPGDVNSLEMYLHFKSNYTTYMTVGDAVVFDTSSNISLAYCNKTGIEYNCTLPDAYLSTKLSHAQLSEKTVPVKISLGNVSSISTVDVMLVNDKSGSLRQSGWNLVTTGNASTTFNNVTVPKDGWSSTNSFTINNTVKKLAVTITWDRKTGYNGSEGSEFVVNLRRPDNTWVFSEYSGNPASAGNKVDPPDSIGQSSEYYSGICTKPQTLLVENPASGTWMVAVYGWNLRPKTSPPSSMDVNISVYADTNMTTSDDLNKTNTTLSYQASMLAANTFLHQLAAEDYAGYVKFESTSTLAQGLTQNKTRVEIAVNNSGVGGGTSIQLGINDANNEMIAHSRAGTQHIMILMTDGQNDAGPTPVIQSANYAKNNGTKIFTIGLTAFVNEEMLRSVASKPEYYYYAPSADDLEEIYNEIAGVINDTYRSQVLNVTGVINQTTLYGDSYIKSEFSPNELLGYGELSFVFSTPPFNDETNCMGYLYVPEDVYIVDAKVTSYSADHWTDYLNINSQGSATDVYRLWYDYGTLQYTMLGDPFTVQVPIQYLASNVNHTLTIGTGDSFTVRTGCSADDRIIYTVRLKMLVQYGDVFQYSDGCIWTIEFEDGNVMTRKIPADYNGTEQCYYMEGNTTQSKADTIDDSVYRLMRHLDIDKDGKVDVIFDPDRVNFETSRAGGVKSLWGPTKFKLILWM
jgi:hypothetical protein